MLVVIAVLAFDFRSGRYTTMALLPLAAGALLLLGAMGLTGHNLNPANMIAFPLIVGVGVNTAVHVLHDFRNRNRGGTYNLTAATGKGIAVSALGTAMGFGALMISGHQGMSGLGFVLSLGVVTCMAAGLVLLPAILRVVSDRRVRHAQRRAAA